MKEREVRSPVAPELSETQVIFIEVESTQEALGQMECPCCGVICDHCQIDYPYTQNQQQFLMPDVWANVCGTCDRKYFDAGVAQSFSDQVFRHLHPLRSALYDLSRGMITEEDATERIRALGENL